MGYVLTNCHTCGWAAGLSCDLPWGDDNYIRVGDFVAEHCQADDGMPAHDSTGCPGWKPKPAAIATHDIPGHRPDDLTHVRAQLAEVGTVKDSSMVAHTSGEWMQVRRAAWDATLATIARLESRIDRLESRADEAERLARGVGPRVASLFRRDRLRGRR